VGPLESVCKSTQCCSPAGCSPAGCSPAGCSPAACSPAEYPRAECRLTRGWLGEGCLTERFRTRRHLSSSARAGQPRCRVEGGVKAIATPSDMRPAAWLGSKTGSSRPALELSGVFSPEPSSPVPPFPGVDGLAVARGWARERSGAAWEQHGN